jgi:uncharacterized membrane protein
MQGPAKFLGHSIHPMLIAFPLGLLPSAVICDIIYLTTKNAAFRVTAFWMLTFGIIGAVAAAIPGLIDWLSIPSGTRAFRTGLFHMFAMIAASGLFILSWIARLWTYMPVGAFVLALAGVLIALVGGWLGGELVQQHGMGVRPEAGLDAPSSLKLDYPSPKERQQLKGREPKPTEPQPV